MTASPHLSTLALQEWSRYGATRLYPEDDQALAIHLAKCSECRKRVEDYRALDLLVHPYGEPGPAAPILYRYRFVLLLALLLAGLVVVLRVAN